jgi:hypothetical protein
LCKKRKNIINKTSSVCEGGKKQYWKQLTLEINELELIKLLFILISSTFFGKPALFQKLFG